MLEGYLIVLRRRPLDPTTRAIINRCRLGIAPMISAKKLKTHLPKTHRNPMRCHKKSPTIAS